MKTLPLLQHVKYSNCAVQMTTQRSLSATVKDMI